MSPAPDKPVIVLIGNYPPDRQESMLRFRDLVESGLAAAGYATEAVFPRGFLGLILKKGPLAKWLGYFDKYLLFPVDLRGRLSRIQRKFPGRKIVVHICDHSNAVYSGVAGRRLPVLVTCHDLLAVRGALGEDTDCPASGFGKLLQQAILRGLARADEVVCVSRATQSDLMRLGGPGMEKRSQVIPLAANYPYRPLPPEEVRRILGEAKIDLAPRGFVLHVGSGLRRKNREALFRAVAQIKDIWTGRIVFAGAPLSTEDRDLARSLGLADRVTEISGPSNELLLALYNAAHALVFMSRFEGFGWPILEAQASGCPVICSNRTSVPEVAGPGALIHEPDDYDGIAADIQRLQDDSFRDSVTADGFRNAQNYTGERMIRAYEKAYDRI